MAKSGAVHGLDITDLCSTNSCSPCVEGAMTNKPMGSPTRLETRPGAVLHTDVAEMDISSVGGGKYFITFIVEESGHVNA